MDDNTKELEITSKEYVNDIRVYIKTCTHYHSYDHTPHESHTPPKHKHSLQLLTHLSYLSFFLSPFGI
jgi:hypothetical protein